MKLTNKAVWLIRTILNYWLSAVFPKEKNKSSSWREEIVRDITSDEGLGLWDGKSFAVRLSKINVSQDDERKKEIIHLKINVYNEKLGGKIKVLKIAMESAVRRGRILLPDVKIDASANSITFIFFQPE